MTLELEDGESQKVKNIQAWACPTPAEFKQARMSEAKLWWARRNCGDARG